MINYAKEWKNIVNFKEMTYDEFVTIFQNKKGYFSRKVDGMLAPFIYNDDIKAFQTTTGQLIENVPVIGEYTSILKKSGQNINNSISKHILAPPPQK